MSTLNILCPNAKRVQVKTSPMMLLQQVLCEACLKSGFDANRHQLQTQTRKIIDLSIPMRLSGIPANATLEMIEKKCADSKSEVELALQIASGKRCQLKVSIDENLWDVLEVFSKEIGEDLRANEGELVPCLIYMNKRYTGDVELSTNSLRSLGISSGRCLIRYQRFALTPEQLEDLRQRQKTEEEKKKQLDEKFAKMKAENEERERLEKQRQMEFDKDAEERRRRDEEQMRRCQATEEKMDVTEPRDVLQNVPVQDPNDWSFNAPVFARQTHRNTMRLEELNRMLEGVDNSLERNDNQQLDEMVNALADGGRMSLSQVRAKAVETIQKKKEDMEEVEVFAEPCDRQMIVFDKLAKKEETMEVDEAFFEVKLEDVKVMQKELRKAVNAQTQAAFVSKSLVAKKNRNRKMEAWKHSVIRVFFGHHVLQMCFDSREPSSRLLESLKLAIKEPTMVNNLKLFCGNLRVNTSDDKNFVDVELAPKATLTAKFGVDVTDGLGMLKNVQCVGVEEADAISASWLSVNKNYEPFNFTVQEDRIQKRPPVNYVPTSSSTSNTGPPAKSALPKWMTVGKK